jgi:hypothetical protein
MSASPHHNTGVNLLNSSFLREKIKKAHIGSLSPQALLPPRMNTSATKINLPGTGGINYI